jgi:hypothetical protein
MQNDTEKNLQSDGISARDKITLDMLKISAEALYEYIKIKDVKSMNYKNMKKTFVGVLKHFEDKFRE